MTTMSYGDAVDAGLAAAMERDERVITFGEDVRLLRRTTLVEKLRKYGLVAGDLSATGT